ncbi:MAG: hypothetical protein KJ833_00150 [Alphaproteobacteria bacterium]|nr:hypothetical protein [Alphaproteobacteria bacterium]MBU4567358.1 hypothetical protein [Alphaproteobacteria bacterium]
MLFAGFGAAARADCGAAQVQFNSASEALQAAYYQRAGAAGTAESVAQDTVAPALAGVQAACPAETGAAAANISAQLTAMLQDPMREQLVACDKATVAFGEKVAVFEQTVGGPEILDGVVRFEVVPAATRAIQACPHVSDMSQRTQDAISDMYAYIDWVADNDY